MWPIGAEAMNTSGVLAVVACGIWRKDYVFLFAECALAGVGGVAIDDVRVERTRIRHDRAATASTFCKRFGDYHLAR